MMILLLVDVPKIKTEKAATAYATQLADQLPELPINDDCAIRRIQTTVIITEKGVR